MINPTSGEVVFSDGFIIGPHRTMGAAKAGLGDPKIFYKSRPLDLPGWRYYYTENHPSDQGTFSADLVTGPEDRIFMVILVHQHPFYETPSPDDSERQAYHSGVIARDLRGQTEFSWGKIHLHTEEKKNWLILVYTASAPVGISANFSLSELIAYNSPAKR